MVHFTINPSVISSQRCLLWDPGSFNSHSTTGPAVPPQHSPGSLFPLLHPSPPRWDQRALVALPGLKEVGIMKGGKRISYSCSKFYTCASFLLLSVDILRVCDQNIATKYQQSNATKVDLFVALKITSLGCCGLRWFALHGRLSITCISRMWCNSVTSLVSHVESSTPRFQASNQVTLAINIDGQTVKI